MERFDAGKYEDEFRRAVLEAVDRKVAGEEVVVVAEPRAQEQIVDLVAALKKSLSDKKTAGDGAARTRKPAKAKGKLPAKAGAAKAAPKPGA